MASFWFADAKVLLVPVDNMSKSNALIKLVTPELDKLPEFLKSIETKWARRSLNLDGPATNAKPRYILSMFPYPSGRLHLGHVRIYTSGDILARFSRLLCKNEKYSSEFNHVINPMGFDSFGLPAENAARERGLHPAAWTNSNIRTMKRQLDDLALQFDWREATSNPSFYKWTQDIFVKLFNAGLAYKSYARVNWDPVDKTVLADEQVDENGRSWRSGALIEKRNFKQWFIKVNAFVNAIYEAEDIKPESWGDILAIQRHWVGKPTGWLFYLPIEVNDRSVETLLVFTKNPELFLKNDTKLVIARNHWLNEVYRVPDGFQIRNPFNFDQIDVISAQEEDSSLPECCQATLLPGSQVDIEDGLSQEVNLERNQVLMQARLNNLGGFRTSDKYRDWLVSRQRFWGTPIPVMNCNNCGLVAANQKSLPVKLPSVESINYSSADSDSSERTISSPIELMAPQDWLVASCPSCGAKAKRECDTLDTLFDSSWYFLRYATSPPSDKPYDQERVMPVWCYIGGKEHASMHLFYARFVAHFLHSQGLLNFREPFSKLMVQGVVKSRTYKKGGKYLTKSEADSLPDKSGLEVDYEKMSKSKGNGVDPEHLLERYGVDATRFCLMSYVNPRTERLWRSDDEEFKDVMLHLRRLILTVEEYTELVDSSKIKKRKKELSETELESKKTEIRIIRDRCLARAIHHIQSTYQFRQYISVIHTLLSSLRANMNSTVIYSEEFAESLASLLVIQSPLTPHLASELWLHFCNNPINPLRNNSGTTFKMDRHVFDQAWPLSSTDHQDTKKSA